MSTPNISDQNNDSMNPDLRRIMRMDALVWAVTMGVMCALGLFVATNWLVIQGGEEVGKHLGLLAHYFVGYSVTFSGSLIGLAYAFVTAFAGTWVLVTVYNWVAQLRSRKG
ncbi:MAG: hypothetical protein ACI9EF_002055 [Pseudohongiellaceae bacterium]|jgi:hypothetical protein